VSWLDAQAYVTWLSERTGSPYRLPSEAEWEYAARAGTTTPFWTGPTISTAQANYDGNYTYGSGEKGIFRKSTVAVDDPSFPANRFGLSHVHGNVWEWIQDCYVNSYQGASLDGHLSVDRNECPGRVLRGGSWIDDPGFLRSASRFRNAPVVRVVDPGFRVARMLTP
jgi:formylglycine-generating enzyme required for sulfatase activity